LWADHGISESLRTSNTKDGTSMLHLIETLIGVAVIYFGLSRFGPADQKKGFFYGVVAVVGLIVTVHGILLFLVPDFFSSSM
jgi:hypothetical protein